MPFQGVLVTAHALERYRERFDAYATATSVAEVVNESSPADGWVYEVFDTEPDHELWQIGAVVFVVAYRSFAGRDLVLRPAKVVITVLPLEWAEQRYEQDGW